MGQGVFSGDKSNKYQVDKNGLRSLTVEKMAKGLQSREGNEMAGLEGRTQLLVRLADALDSSSEFFGQDGRPGNLLGRSRPVGTRSVGSSHANSTHRLLVGSSVNTGIVDAHRPLADLVERPHVRLSTHMASLAYRYQRHLPWRRVALLRHASTECILRRPKFQSLPEFGARRVCSGLGVHPAVP